LFLFSAAIYFGCLHQPSSSRHPFTKRIKRERPLLTKSGEKFYKIVLNIISKNGTLTLNGIRGLFGII